MRSLVWLRSNAYGWFEVYIEIKHLRNGVGDGVAGEPAVSGSSTSSALQARSEVALCAVVAGLHGEEDSQHYLLP